MLQQTPTKQSPHFSYRCYLQYNAASHPDGFIAPQDWLHVWNMQQWLLQNQPVQRKRTLPFAQPVLSPNRKTG